ncbi:hypothetical protein T484DRAFT_1804845 [Baffinella frigidus]|nr:hypothetical protein T484DRAFT_1804845 [Cryptophyta sp. CCMP2293]
MHDSEKNPNVEERTDLLIEFFTYSLYRNVCRSLFEKARSRAKDKDKVLYSFLVCTRLMLSDTKITSAELRFLLSGVGGVYPGKPPEKPADWIPDRTWTEVIQVLP